LKNSRSAAAVASVRTIADAWNGPAMCHGVALVFAQILNEPGRERAAEHRIHEGEGEVVIGQTRRADATDAKPLSG